MCHALESPPFISGQDRLRQSEDCSLEHPGSALTGVANSALAGAIIALQANACYEVQVIPGGVKLVAWGGTTVVKQAARSGCATSAGGLFPGGHWGCPERGNAGGRPPGVRTRACPKRVFQKTLAVCGGSVRCEDPWLLLLATAGLGTSAFSIARS